VLGILESKSLRHAERRWTSCVPAALYNLFRPTPRG
jgi:hypothetical protein